MQRKKVIFPGQFVGVDHRKEHIDLSSLASDGKIPASGLILYRTELSHCLGVAKTTVDAWVKRGCPVRSKNGKGVPSQYDTGEVFAWYAAYMARQRY